MSTSNYSCKIFVYFSLMANNQTQCCTIDYLPIPRFCSLMLQNKILGKSSASGLILGPLHMRRVISKFRNETMVGMRLSLVHMRTTDLEMSRVMVLGNRGIHAHDPPSCPQPPRYLGVNRSHGSRQLYPQGYPYLPDRDMSPNELSLPPRVNQMTGTKSKCIKICLRPRWLGGP